MSVEGKGAWVVGERSIIATKSPCQGDQSELTEALLGVDPEPMATLAA